MGCQSEVYLEDNLTFSICTHDPETGVLTDAAAAPSYIVYEDEIEAAILTGDMAKLDNANTTGFYTEKIACTAANGFEDGKSYTIYIEATVDTFTGGIAFSFKAKSKTLVTVAANVVLVKAATDKLHFDSSENVKSVQQFPTGAVVADGGNSTLTFKTNLSEVVNNYWAQAWLKFTSGDLIYQVRKVTGYNGSSKFISFSSAFTGTPAGSDTFDLIVS